MFFEITGSYTVFFSILLFFLLFLNIFSLPANWFILFAFLFLYFTIETPNRYFVLAVLFLIAVGGEVLESIIQFRISKKSGASTAGNWGGILGAIVGAILGFPLFFGVGSLLFALIGAFIGCFCIEIIRGMDSSKACSAAFGALKGKFLGFILKITFGAIMIFYGISSLSSVPLKDSLNEEQNKENKVDSVPYINL